MEEIKFKPEENFKTEGERPDLSQAGGSTVLIKNAITTPNYSPTKSGIKIGTNGKAEFLSGITVGNVLETTNFKKLFQEPNSGVAIYLSDQTTPNGALTAAEGSICLNSSATGQIAYNNDGSSSWVLL